ncbi:AraC family transcriptional regulator [Paenibacillus hodogayensis]|uniref:AraC family transcriptional regulator n=1 Tax=Paenibacillus hodogayensis TaxID=279208 RepID=A0ABV5W8A6_9BACL
MEFIYTSPLGLADLEVWEVGTQDCWPGAIFGPGVRDMYILHYVHDGQGTYEQGGRAFRVGPGELFLIVPDAVHAYRPDAAMPWSYSWIGFNGSFAARFIEQAGFTEMLPVKQADPDRPVEPLFRDMMGCRDLPAKELLLTGLLYRLLGMLAVPDETVPLRANVGVHVRQAVAFMNARYMERIGLADIASHVGLDEKYVCRLFQQSLSMSPYRYLTEIRMRKACRLLRRQLPGIAEIARSVGYQDPLLFSRMFKKTLGLSPSAYREQSRRQSV